MGSRPTEVTILGLLAAGASLVGCRSLPTIPGLPVIRAVYSAPKAAPVTCVGVVELDRKRTWGPDGWPAKVPTSPFDGVSSSSPGGIQSRGIVFAVPGLPTGTEPTYIVSAVGPNTTLLPTFPTYDSIDHLWLITAVTSYAPATADVTVEDTSGPWAPVAAYQLTRGVLKVVSPPSLAALTFRLASHPGGRALKAKITLAPSAARVTVRMLCWDSNGSELPSLGVLRGGELGRSTMTHEIGVPQRSVSRIEIQQYAGKSFIFRNVNLQPR